MIVEPVPGVAATEPIQAVGQPIEVDSPGGQPSRGTSTRSAESNGETVTCSARSRDDEHRAQGASDDREPPPRPAEGGSPIRFEPWDRHDGEEAHGEDERANHRPAAEPSSDGHDRVAARRKLDLLGLGVGQALDQLVTELRARQ